MLLVSGNDAANTLADMLGGFDAAVAKMNAKAAALGATDTHAATPSGLDGPGGTGWTTPRDLAIIFRAAMANPVFAQITSPAVGDVPRRHRRPPLVNENQLLQRYPGTLGGKTGFTDAARKTYVAAAQRDGRRLVISMMYGLVVEGGPTYWDQAAGLLDWGFAQASASQHRRALTREHAAAQNHDIRPQSAPPAPARGSSAKQIRSADAPCSSTGRPSHRRASQHAAPSASVGVMPIPFRASTSSAIRPWATIEPASVPA